jgi:CHAD domain-containing protein
MAKAREIPGLEASDPFGAAAAKVVAARAQELFDRGEGVLDIEDIERVHDMRVASRRLRAVLEIFAPAFPRKAHRAALKDVKRLADALGERRDPDVQILGLERFAAGVPATQRRGPKSLAARLRVEQAAGNETLAAELQRARESDLPGRLRALVESAR